MEDRIVRLEVEMEQFRKEVARMHSSALALTEEVRNIQRTLNQIKYYAFGLATFVVANDLGWIQILKGVL